MLSSFAKKTFSTLLFFFFVFTCNIVRAQNQYLISNFETQYGANDILNVSWNCDNGKTIDYTLHITTSNGYLQNVLIPKESLYTNRFGKIAVDLVKNAVVFPNQNNVFQLYPNINTATSVGTDYVGNPVYSALNSVPLLIQDEFEKIFTLNSTNTSSFANLKRTYNNTPLAVSVMIDGQYNTASDNTSQVYTGNGSFSNIVMAANTNNAAATVRSTSSNTTSDLAVTPILATYGNFKTLSLGIVRNNTNTPNNKCWNLIVVVKRTDTNSIIDVFKYSIYTNGAVPTQTGNKLTFDSNNDNVSLYAYPTVFNEIAELGVELPQDMPVDLRISNLTGQQVAVLCNNKWLEAGYYNYNFNSTNLPSGLYIVTLRYAENTIFKKIIKQ